MTEQYSPVSINPRNSTLAVVSFIMGLLCLTCVLWPLLGLPAIICGIIALVKISGSNGSLKGKGYAITGIILPAVMVVLLPFLAMFMAIGMPTLAKAKDVAQRAACQATLRSLDGAVNMFEIDTGRYPTQEEGLNALIKKPSGVEGWTEGGYLEGTKIPQDAWKHDFVYKLNPGDGHPFVIISYGADGKEGGQGDDADLRSTDE